MTNTNLCIRRNAGEVVTIVADSGEQIEIKVSKATELRISAPRSFLIMRRELIETEKGCRHAKS